MDIIGLVKNSGAWCGEKSKSDEKYIRHLICPECKSTDAYIKLSSPGWIHCSHRGSCRYDGKLSDAYPAIFAKIESGYDTKTEPDAPALRYLSMVRGLNKSLIGLEFKYLKKTRIGKNTGKQCGGAVMFPISDGNRHTTNGRLINPPPGEQKGHNGPNTRGCWWQHSKVEYDPEKQSFMCEAVINACSIIELGEQAFSVGFAMGDPNDYALPECLTKNLVIAFDFDAKGISGAKKWKKSYPEAKVIMLPSSDGDWNDFIIRYGKDSGDEFQKRMSEFEAWGQMAVSEDAKEYADIYKKHFDRPLGIFEWGQCYWYGDKKEAYPVSNFLLSPVHYELDSSDPDRHDNSIRIKIIPKSGADSTNTVMPLSDFASPGNLKTLFLKRARVLWSGEKGPTDGLAKKILNSRKVPIVRKMKHVGYDQESGCYVFPSYMIDTDGKMNEPEHGLFRNGRNGKDCIRPLAKSQFIKPKECDFRGIYQAICEAWPGIGEIAVAWTIASLFVNQIKDENGHFPHMSFWDDSQTGKSTLALAIARMCGRDIEGVPFTKHANAKGIVRNIAVVSGAPVGILEAGGTSKMDVTDFVLTTYMKGMLQTRAKFSNDLETADIPCYASLLFVQNNEPFGTKPEKERVISLRFEFEKMVNEKTYEGFKRLKSFSPGQLAWFIPTIMKSRVMIESTWKDRHEQWKDTYSKDVKDNRVVDNHSIVRAFHDIVCEILGFQNDIDETMDAVMKAKWMECAGKSDTLGDHIFNTIDSMKDGMGYSMSIDVDERGMLYVNFPELFREMQRQGFALRASSVDIYDAMKNHPSFVRSSLSHRFKDCNTGVRSGGKSSWVFDTGKIVKKDGP